MKSFNDLYNKLLELVHKEAKKLIKHATPEEIARLNILKLNPCSTMNCIYGQMTKYCYSARAQELIIACAERVYLSSGGISCSNIFTLNGKPEPLENPSQRDCRYHSPIELFILINKEEEFFDLDRKTIKKIKGNNDKLVSYLKGEIKTLRFTRINN